MGANSNNHSSLNFLRRNSGTMFDALYSNHRGNTTNHRSATNKATPSDFSRTLNPSASKPLGVP